MMTTSNRRESGMKTRRGKVRGSSLILAVLAIAVAAAAIIVGCGEPMGPPKIDTDRLIDVGRGRDTGNGTTDAKYELTIGVFSADGGSGTVYVNEAPSTGTALYKAGETVKITARPDQNCGFVGWTGTSDDDKFNARLEFKMNNTMRLTAIFKRETIIDTGSTTVEDTTFELRTSVSTMGTGAIVGGEIYVNEALSTEKTLHDAGDEVTVRARETEGYEFVMWVMTPQLLENMSNASLTFKMRRDVELNAIFKPVEKYTLTVRVNPAGGGIVLDTNNARLASLPNLTSGTSIKIKAVAEHGYMFKRWEGSGIAEPTSTITTVTVNSNVTITAVFEETVIPPATYTLTVNKEPENGGTVSRDPDLANYPEKTEATVTATPAEGYTFTGWTGASTSASAAVTVTMDENKTLTANFSKQEEGRRKLTVRIEGSGRVNVHWIDNDTMMVPVRSGNDTTFSLRPGTRVTIMATTDDFIGWLGDLTSTESRESLIVDSDMVIVANYQQSYTLVTNVNPVDGGGGRVTRSPDKAAYTAGTQVTVTATPADGYMFTGWTGASSSTSAAVTIIMDDNKTLTANFRPIRYYGLSTGISPTDGGTVKRNPDQQTYAEGTWVTVTATAAAGYSFTGWSGASSSTSAAVTIFMDDHKTLTALFKQQYTLTTSITPAGSGSVSRNPNQTNYQAGTSVTVTATPAEGYMFTGWSGAVTSTNTAVTVTMNSNLLLTANFKMRDDVYIDTRDGQNKIYNTVKIGGRTWMAENLNYPTTSNSWCHEKDNNCQKYGRLYTWDVAMGACPSGWRLPTRADWDALVQAAGGANVAGTKLKSKTDWLKNGNGTDDYNFSAKPGGYRVGAENFSPIGDYGAWWSATSMGNDLAHNRLMTSAAGVVEESTNKGYGLSVRCAKD